MAVEGTFREARRGYSPGDKDDFSASAQAILSRAAEEVSYLVDRDYPRASAITFVGDRYQLTERQRLLLARAVSGELARESRAGKLLGLSELEGKEVLIDGFNTVITLEVALSGSPIIIGQDGTVRDLAGLRGTYHIIDKTPRAISLVLDVLEDHGTADARFFFDRQVSNSGRISQLVREMGSGRSVGVEAETLGDVDGFLSGSDRVITSDSVVLDSCRSWFNLNAEVISGLSEGDQDGIWVVDIFGSPSDDGHVFCRR